MLRPYSTAHDLHDLHNLQNLQNLQNLFLSTRGSA